MENPRLDIMKKIKEMQKENAKWLLKECERLMKSGGIDTSEHEGNFRIPKIIYSVALENAAYQYTPFDKSDRKKAANLKHF